MPAPTLDLKSLVAEVRTAVAAFLAANPSAAVAEPVRERRPPPRPGHLSPAEPAAPAPEEAELPLLARRVVSGGGPGPRPGRAAPGRGPGGRRAARRCPRAQPLFALELPIAGPSGVSLATLRVERDGGQDPGQAPDPSGPNWRIELALAVEPLGAMEARIGLMPGRRMVAGLWCHDPAAIGPLEAEIARLRTELEAAGLTLGAFDVHIGRPPPRPRPAAPPAHRIDLAL